MYINANNEEKIRESLGFKNVKDFLEVLENKK